MCYTNHSLLLEEVLVDAEERKFPAIIVDTEDNNMPAHFDRVTKLNHWTSVQNQAQRQLQGHMAFS